MSTNTCAHCGRGGYLQTGFDRLQCTACGGFTTIDGKPTVPSSALEADGTWDGPGAELVADPAVPPFKATDPQEV